MLALLILTTLTFQTPTLNAGPNCESSSTPLHDLDKATLWGWRDGDRSLWRLAEKRVQPGRLDSLWFYPFNRRWRCYVTFSDTAGNQSCASNVVTVGGPVAVEDREEDVRRRWRIYDVQGRRVAELSHRTLAEARAATRQLEHGVYLLRSGDRTERVLNWR